MEKSKSQTPVLKTKAYYKAQWQQRQEEEALARRSKMNKPTAPSPTVAVVRPCHVRLERVLPPAGARTQIRTPVRSTTRPRLRFATPQIVATVEISDSDEADTETPELPPTPPAPSPQVSTDDSDIELVEELGVLGPARSSSPRDGGDTSSDSEATEPRQNARLVPDRPVEPPPTRLASQIVVPVPSVAVELPFLCEEELPVEIRQGLQYHIRSVKAARRGNDRRKQIAYVCGRRFRLIANRHGQVIVQLRS
ncbi:uncharacterized protein LOC142241450 [Haematobia irritans]|uniref:uncharacterized protein LOC142241450 n=1 Tax=Haematobia irritans TaxID=7368 RepID=UPI003F4FF675